ncbi:hypothetical protein [Geobacter pickeringii]|uniref:Metallothionein n=1 Tax=Geobacter pickeringii TaxID=345632 RepID=A0A0B5BFI0_9BACT|nr:hypothetical protein [Geobacter pickeringii]AJE03879.1 hypothetical protein GPICK_11415 [Geobacter pickeringii]
MKKFVMALVAALCLGMAAGALAGGGAIKAGDEIYVCNCGEKCPCGEIAKKAGRCTCGKDMVKARVTGVEKGKVVVTLDGREREFKTVGKYACGCAGCGCGSTAQSAGKCACGKPMKEAKP